ncbi:MAG: putative reductase [Thermoleophilia bacterium]|nr:putative reductase [Thermoleophilia bacterium]
MVMAPPRMKLLVLGGAGLSGTAITLAALDRGHEVVAVHRMGSGTLANIVHERLTEFVRDRSHGHAGIEQLGPFDAIIDVSARVPAVVADAVVRLDDPRTHWLQLSSVAAYADHSGELREGAALAHFADVELEARANRDLTIELGDDVYSAAKANCERMLARGVRDSSRRVTIVRPVLITGRYDDTRRIPYWVERVTRGGTVLAPPADAPLQVVDARDVAEFVLCCVEQRRAGSFNLAPPIGAVAFADLLEACRSAALAMGSPPVRVLHASDAELSALGVEPWSELPGWLPAASPHRGFVTTASDRARATGFRTRPVAETVAAVQEWLLTDHGARAPETPPGLSAARERELVARLTNPQLPTTTLE